MRRAGVGMSPVSRSATFSESAGDVAFGLVGALIGMLLLIAARSGGVNAPERLMLIFREAIPVADITYHGWRLDCDVGPESAARCVVLSRRLPGAAELGVSSARQVQCSALLWGAGRHLRWQGSLNNIEKGLKDVRDAALKVGHSEAGR
jgi:hypothetical protein